MKSKLRTVWKLKSNGLRITKLFVHKILRENARRVMSSWRTEGLKESDLRELRIHCCNQLLCILQSRVILLILNIYFEGRLLGYSKQEFAGLQCCSGRVGSMRALCQCSELTEKRKLSRTQEAKLGYYGFGVLCQLLLCLSLQTCLIFHSSLSFGTIK